MFDSLKLKKHVSWQNKLTLVPEMAKTSVDFPWATWPMVPMFWVAYLEIISGSRGVISSILSFDRS